MERGEEEESYLINLERWIQLAGACAELEATVTTESIPRLGFMNGMFVRADDTRLFTADHTLALHNPSTGVLSTVAGCHGQGRSERRAEARRHTAHAIYIHSGPRGQHGGGGLLSTLKLRQKPSSVTRCLNSTPVSPSSSTVLTTPPPLQCSLSAPPCFPALSLAPFLFNAQTRRL